MVDRNRCLIKLDLTSDWFSDYNKAPADNVRRVATDIKPKTLYIKVRVLEDHGELETGDGEIKQLKQRRYKATAGQGAV